MLGLVAVRQIRDVVRSETETRRQAVGVCNDGDAEPSAGEVSDFLGEDAIARDDNDLAESRGDVFVENLKQGQVGAVAARAHHVARVRPVAGGLQEADVTSADDDVVTGS